MGTLSSIPPDRELSGSQRGTALFLRKAALSGMKERLLGARALAEKRVPPHQMRELNEKLWDAFTAKNTDEMLRLVKAGANPNSIESRLEREIVNCEY